MRPIIFELCAETIAACIAARDGGADRIEICSGLSEGGVTPSHGLVRAAIESSDLPVHVLIRPRAGDFLYSEAELAVMIGDIRHVKMLDAAGVVLGVLRPDGTVDVACTKHLVEEARPMEVTFHRAFDTTPSLQDALEAVIEAQCDRVLTSGGQRDVVAGASQLASLVRQAKDRIHIAVGGGLRLQNAASVALLTGANHFHGSVRRSDGDRLSHAPATPLPVTQGRYVVDAAAVRAIIHTLQDA